MQLFSQVRGGFWCYRDGMTTATETLEITYSEFSGTRDLLEELELLAREARRAADTLDGPASLGMTTQERYAATERIWRDLLAEIYAMDSGR
ncbi:hypothetical protein MFAL_13490 [Mycolicibacterium fallax]|nr:hypothetical protein MFAL_13490 [Mycolicibacterium fallax]